ncbi:MAG: recombinase family protein [Rikenellaceae bacterium]
MKKGYIQSVNSVSEFQQIVKSMNEIDVSSDNIVINPSFSDYIKTVEPGDCIVVSSLDLFSSLSELMDTTVELAQRGIRIKSLADAWYDVSPEMAPVLIGIIGFGKRIRASSWINESKSRRKNPWASGWLNKNC